MSVTKKDLAKEVSKKISLSKKESYLIVNTFFSSITKNYTKRISINKFGTFLFKETPKRFGRNPKTLEEYEVKARMKMTFKPSEEIKKNIN